MLPGQQSPAASGFTTDAVDNGLCSDIQSRNDNLLANVATAVVKEQPVLMCQL